LQHKFARLHCVPPGPQPEPLPNSGGRRLRVGFVSRYLGEHTIGRLFHGAIVRLDSRAFEVVVFSLGRSEGPVADALRRRADEHVELPFDLAAARRAVLDRRLDLLCYCDVGMEPWGTALAHARLAPVQCATWGHPVTTGIDAVDYFISAEALEVPEADEHYTEKLVRLPRLFCYYERPQLPDPPAARSAFGLPADAHLYGCLQTLFKFHPDFDPLIAAILRRDPRGMLTLLAGREGIWRDRLWQRFRRTLPDVLDRIRVLPLVPRSEYLQLVAVHDVLLDPVHFGGGNTSYEGFACGVPIVTWPSGLLRGRITAALYAQMGLSHCVATSAEQFVDMAVRLGTDPDHRRATAARIEQAAPQIFDNDAGVRELEAFFRRTVSSSGAHSP
jgi:predicted O-linked N-acetylglucosamine transferase (SPINDLY family)